MSRISVVINTKNSGSTLERALKSVSWCEDIVVVDMQSTDNTKQIAKKYTSHIFDFEDVGYVEPARNFAINKAKGEWVLVLDADEEVNEGLVEKLPHLITQKNDVYDIPRKNIVFDKWMKHAGWWPDYQRRLFRKGSLVWGEKIHSIPKVTGKVHKIDPASNMHLVHHNYQSIEQYIDRLNRYTTIEAKQLKGQVTNHAKMLEQGFSEIFSRYFKLKGYRDDLHGLSVTLLQMFYQITTQLKVWQQNHFENADDSVKKVFPEIIKQMNYWYADFRSKTTKNPFSKTYWLIRKYLSLYL